MKGILARGHVPETDLARLADDPRTRDGLSDHQRQHLETCDRCRGLVDGHRLAGRLFAAPWQFVTPGPTIADHGTQRVRGVTATGSAGRPIGRPSPIWVALALLLLSMLIGALVVGALRLPTGPPLAVYRDGPACGAFDRYARQAGAITAVGWGSGSSAGGPSSTVSAGSIAGWAERQSGEFDVVLIDPHTGAESPLTTFRRPSSQQAHGLAWSPDGLALALAFDDHHCSDVFVATEGSLVRPAPGNVDNQSMFFGWSPDSSRLAIVRFDRLMARSGGVGEGESVWVARQDGGPTVELGSPCDGCEVRYPSWSPDGSAIATTYAFPDPGLTARHRGLAFTDPTRAGWRTHELDGAVSLIGWLDDTHVLAHVQPEVEGIADRLVSVTVDEPWEVRTLAIDAQVDAPADGFVLSPDRSMLAYPAAASGGGTGRTDLAVVDLASGATTVVWGGLAYTAVTWSPDGRSLAVSAFALDPPAKSSRPGVWIVNVDGSGSRRIREQPLGGLAWQPLWP